jgi:hypothetical protein
MSSEDENLESLARELGFETPAASRSTVQTSGELGSGGGYLSSVRAGNMFASDEESVPVFVVHSEGGEDVCRGLIGVEGRRFCIKELESGKTDCGTASHSKSKAELQKGDAFICVPKGKSLSYTSATLLPTVNVTTLSPSLESQLQEGPRPVLLWAQVFSGLSEEASEAPYALCPCHVSSSEKPN